LLPLPITKEKKRRKASSLSSLSVEKEEVLSSFHRKRGREEKGKIGVKSLYISLKEGGKGNLYRSSATYLTEKRRRKVEVRINPNHREKRVLGFRRLLRSTEKERGRKNGHITLLSLKYSRKKKKAFLLD